jgi:predicted nuclease of predicted toxin-antitoxin system
MKFLTDENISKSTIKTLRENEIELIDVKEENLEGTSDNVLVELANQENLLIITMDKDFAQLFNNGLIKNGVVLILDKRQKSKQITTRLMEFLKNKTQEDLEGKLSIVK